MTSHSARETNEPQYPHWEKIKDLVDQYIDIMLNHSQSGHPGGSRSKVHGLVTMLLSGAMRWDIRHPGKRFADRFVLSAGHVNPLVYAALAVFNEALRVKHARTGDARYAVPHAAERQLTWEDLLTLRRRGGLPGHAEMAGKTLFLKFNTGPSGHGIPVAVGQALALKAAGVPEVKVFAIEGEGGLTTGVTHESLSSAWGLGLDNLVFFVDWNDYGIDDRPFSTVVKPTPEELFACHGWHTAGTEAGESWEAMDAAFGEACRDGVGNPRMVWSRNHKGRGYYVYDNKSHGAPHKRDSENYWKCRQDFADKYGVEWEGFGQPPAATGAGQHTRTEAHLRTVAGTLAADEALLDYLADRLVELGDAVPEELPGFRLTGAEPLPPLTDLPDGLFAAPGTNAPNRAALASFGAWLNATVNAERGVPQVLAASADLADSTNISGFAKGWDDLPGTGLYNRDDNTGGGLLPQGITEMATAGMLAGAVCVNFADDPYAKFVGFYGACSTYGSFSYLKYGPFRVLSQTAQDTEFKVGKVIWVVGHSGPETAEDSRTHFGIFSPGVTDLFPAGKIINLHPWEHNEVAPMLACALNDDVPLIALHLTRPGIEIPDRAALGMSTYHDAAKGAYVMRDYDERPRQGVVIVRGTSATANLVPLLQRLADGPNLKVVAATSHELFAAQPVEYREAVLSEQELHDAMVVTNGALRLMSDWVVNPVVREYSLSSDWDDNWRGGGFLDEVIEDAHLSPDWLWNGMTRFAAERPQRLARLRAAIPEVDA